MRWPTTVLTERLAIRYPILQAPMSGGPGTPQLVAAVSNAGGLGCLVGSHLHADALRQAITAVRALTEQPFAVALSAALPAKVDPVRISRAQQLLAPFRVELGLPLESPPFPELPKLEEQLNVILEMRVPVLQCLFGAPNSAYIRQLQEAGTVLLGTATHLLEAIVLEESGIDFIIAQGAEAGGHRSSFVGSPEQSVVGIMTLIPLLNQHIQIPIIASGGIMDGRGIAAAQMLGASGVQMGTAFLACPESGTHPAHKALLGQGSEIATLLTRCFSGRYGRVLRNRFVNALHAHDAELPGFPLQMFLIQDIQRVAIQRGLTDLMALWAGQGCHLCEERPAAELLATWVEQASSLLFPATISTPPFTPDDLPITPNTDHLVIEPNQLTIDPELWI